MRRWLPVGVLSHFCSRTHCLSVCTASCLSLLLSSWSSSFAFFLLTSSRMLMNCESPVIIYEVYNYTVLLLIQFTKYKTNSKIHVICGNTNVDAGLSFWLLKRTFWLLKILMPMFIAFEQLAWKQYPWGIVLGILMHIFWKWCLKTLWQCHEGYWTKWIEMK